MSIPQNKFIYFRKLSAFQHPPSVYKSTFRDLAALDFGVFCTHNNSLFNAANPLPRKRSQLIDFQPIRETHKKMPQFWCKTAALWGQYFRSFGAFPQELLSASSEDMFRNPVSHKTKSVETAPEIHEKECKNLIYSLFGTSPLRHLPEALSRSGSRDRCRSMDLG